LIASGKLNPRPLATHTFTFEEFPAAYEAFGNAAQTKACKVVIKAAA
jgi:alcohol dehydrogenase